MNQGGRPSHPPVPSKGPIRLRLLATFLFSAACVVQANNPPAQPQYYGPAQPQPQYQQPQPAPQYQQPQPAPPPAPPQPAVTEPTPPPEPAQPAYTPPPAPPPQPDQAVDYDQPTYDSVSYTVPG